MTGGWPVLLIISGQGVEPVGSVFVGCGVRFSIKTGPNLETKIALQKSLSVAMKIVRHRLKYLGFMKRFSEFAKGIYETCDCNFFNLALAVVFSIVQ